MQDLTIFKEIIISMIKSLGGSVTKDYVLEPWFYRIINRLNLDYFNSVYNFTIDGLIEDGDICDFANMLIVLNEDTTKILTDETAILKEAFPNYPDVGCTLKDVSKDYMLTFEDYKDIEGLVNFYAIALVMDNSQTFKDKIRNVDLRNVVSEYGNLIYCTARNTYTPPDGYGNYDDIASMYVLYSSGTLKFVNGEAKFDFSNVAAKYFASFNTAYIIANLDLYDDFKGIFVDSVKICLQDIAMYFQVDVERGIWFDSPVDAVLRRKIALYGVVDTFGDKRVSLNIIENFLMTISDFTFNNCNKFKETTKHFIYKRAKVHELTQDATWVFAKLLSENSVK